MCTTVKTSNLENLQGHYCYIILIISEYCIELFLLQYQCQTNNKTWFIFVCALYDRSACKFISGTAGTHFEGFLDLGKVVGLDYTNCSWVNLN
jgi:hypothetical protein